MCPLVEDDPRFEWNNPCWHGARRFLSLKPQLLEDVHIWIVERVVLDMQIDKLYHTDSSLVQNIFSVILESGARYSLSSGKK